MKYDNKASCIYCKEVRIARGIHTHVDRAHLNSTKYSSGYNGSYQKSSEKAKQKREMLAEEYLKSPKLCEQCNDIIPYHPRINNRFCSRSCSAKCNNTQRSPRTQESKDRTSLSLMSRHTSYTPVYFIDCAVCNTIFASKSKSDKHCSSKCKAERHHSVCHLSIANYRKAAAFTFGLSNYPDEFDFAIVNQYGWYKAKNHGDNLNGVSRDHIVSVKYGFDNNIDPAIISHPANCRLMRHNDNVSKGKKCDMSVDQLLEKIQEWNSKYCVY